MANNHVLDGYTGEPYQISAFLVNEHCPLLAILGEKMNKIGEDILTRLFLSYSMEFEAS